MIVDAFSGAGGWHVGAARLGLHPVGIEFDADACATAKAAGHHVVRQDVTTLSLKHLLGKVEGLVGSPPCTDFSKAGKRRGIRGETGSLIFQMERLWLECRPEWIALEQVPEVLPFWSMFANALRQIGYDTWCGILDSADYGVPQNRLRAILIASRVREVGPPPPTHAEHPHPVMFGAELLPWVSMAGALGHEFACRLLSTPWLGDPRPCSSSARTVAFGHDVNSWEWHLDTHRDQRRDGTTQTREIQAPAPAITGKSAGQWAFERPATTVMCDSRIFPPTGHHPYQQQDSWSCRAVKVTLEELAALQSFPPGYPFVGSKTSRARQIGNAIPSLLAMHVLAMASGVLVPLLQEVTR